MVCLNISDFAIITVKSVNYCCIIYGVRKFEGIHLLESFVLEDRGYIYKKCISKRSVLKVEPATIMLTIQSRQKIGAQNIRKQEKTSFINKKNYKYLMIYFARCVSV